MPTKTFYMSRFWQVYNYLFVVLGLGIAAFFSYTVETAPASSRTAMRPWFYLLAVFCLALFLSIFFAMRGVRLVVSEQGIVYGALGYSVRTAWDNVIGTSDEWPYVGLALAQSGLVVSWWLKLFFDVQGPLTMFSALGGSPTKRVDPDLLGRRIPLEPFIKHWQESELGDWVRRYAPRALKQQVEEPATQEAWPL